ncbi:hypothetical protein SPRG_11978 [Saprolegnia parasitica CBS 223.65]|uniref:Vacuolar protein 8 n=1 Tax=Saprolegnia parasitica (strain CBS 223.65) TaxID=695850 RepID=A0A067C8H7_SAPPC|nr:hypothetical protein SPRG_11978 [Saprolegnia parasitica CBS 223.65]KDO22841.1 hypothetical protein SPRG_11978 [Saprolegnia parasitica CBS 223.65]|eukprot:XP_012206398.1 hypothetical protein SPRG_11978 [Saprolegnia parasitica CBS 223.65]
MAEEMETHVSMLEFHAMPNCVRLFRSRYVSVYRKGSRCAANLLSSADVHALFLHEEGLLGLLRVAKANGVECQYSVALRCLPCLFRLLGATGLAVQRQAAAALKALCANAVNKPFITDNGIIPAIILLLRAQDVELQPRAAGALWHLSLHLPVICRRERSCPLFKACKFEELKLQCAGALANLSENTKTQKVLVAQGSLHALMELAKAMLHHAAHGARVRQRGENQVNVFSTDELKAMFMLANQLQIAHLGGFVLLIALLTSFFLACREYAARCLYRSSAHKENQHHIVDAGSLGPLIALVSDAAFVECQRNAAIALCNLASCHENELPIVEAHGLPPLIQLLESPSPECTRYAAMTLCNLAGNSANQVHIVKAHGLKPLIRVASEANAESARYACMAIANVSTHRQNRLVVVDEGALRPLVSLATSDVLECQRSATLAIYNVSCAAVNQVRIVEQNVHVHLIELATSPDTDCKLYATMALCNLTANAETRIPASRAGGLQALIVVHGSLAAILLLWDSDDADDQRYAIMALANSAASETNHPTMTARGVLKVVLRLATAPRDDIRQYAAFALANFAGNAEHCNTIGDEGGVAPLIALAHSEDPNAHAIAALRRLCQVSATNRGRIVRGGGLVPLALADHSEELETQREVAATLCNLSLSDEYKMEIVLSGALPPLITLGQSPDVEVARQACGAIANLAEKIETHATFAAAHGGRFLIGLMRHKSIDIHRDASRAMANLLTSFGHHGDMIAEGLPNLIHLALSVDTECQYNAALALRKLAPNTASHRGIVCEGGLKSLLFLLESKETNIRKHAVVALRDVASNAAYQVRFYEEGGVSALVTFVRDVEPNLQCPALAALRHLSCATELKKPIVQAGVLRPLLKCINPAGHHVDLLCQCAGLLANLSEHLENQLTMVEKGATTGLIQQDVARALANLSANEDNHSTIYKQGGLKCLIGLTRSKEEVCQRYAAMGLRFLASNPTIRVHIVQENLLPPFLALAQSPALDYQRTGVRPRRGRDRRNRRALALAGLALGDHGHNKLRMVTDGAVRPLVEMLRYPSVEIQKCGCLALNALTLGKHAATKLAVLQEDGLLPLLALLSASDMECVCIALYCVGSIAEHMDVLTKLLELGALAHIVHQSRQPDLEVKRNCGYILALDVEHHEFHDDFVREGGLQIVAHLASNREYQVKFVNMGALRPLIAIMSVNAEPRHYAGLALLKLADNYENHIKIAEEGGIQALLRIARARSTDEELQYKASMSLGQLAANATKVMPKGRHSNDGVGAGASRMAATTEQLQARKARETTTEYIEKKIRAQTDASG